MGKRRGPGGTLLQGLLVYPTKRMMTSPSTKPDARALLSQIAFTMDALNGCMNWGTIAFITELPCGEDAYVEESTNPRSHPVEFIAIVWMICAVNVWSMKVRLGRESQGESVAFKTSHYT
jgi:hypothetical protein